MNNLNDLIKTSGLKKQKIAKYIGVADSTLTRYINNQTYPNINRLKKLAYILNVKIGDIKFDELMEDK
jgi:transcriptional regulator with XRE-family HTH domain